MANRLPIPGGDDGTWGDILNAYLAVSHNSDGTLANNSVGTNQLQNGSVTNIQLDSTTQSAITKANSSVQQVNSKSPDTGGNVSLTASDVSAIPASQLGTASGVATLDGSGNVPASQLDNAPTSSINITSPDGSIAVGGTASAPTLQSAVPSVFSRTGAVVATSGDYNATQIPNVVATIAQSATPAIDTDNANFFSITGLAQAITSMTTNLTGTPVHGQFIWIEITDNGAPRAITWGSSFASASVTLPTTTVASTTVRVGLTWNTITSTWDAIAGGSSTGGSGGSSFTPTRTAYTTAGSNSFTIPAGCTTMTVTCIGGGGGGGSGRQGAPATACVGGAGGGGGGLSIQRFLATDFSSPVTVVVGAGGSGASAQATADTNGTAGGAGGQSKFGTALAAGGGNGGAAGTASNGSNAAGGSGISWGNPGGSTTSTGGNGSNISAGAGGGGGGGGGGGISAANAASAGGGGSISSSSTQGTPGSGGAATGANGGTATAPTSAEVPGVGGGGGGTQLAGTGGSGSAGAGPGGGGGGGGASNDGFASGAGGAGHDGAVFILCE